MDDSAAAMLVAAGLGGVSALVLAALLARQRGQRPRRDARGPSPRIQNILRAPKE